MVNFRDHLSQFFGRQIINLILRPSILEIKPNVKQLLDNNSITPKKCQGCPLSVNKKMMDFPGWVGELESNAVHKKEVMVIGISPNSLEIPVHIAYGFGYEYFTEKDIVKLKKGAKKFWNMLYYLFEDKVDYLHKNLYIMDLAFCNCSSKDRKTLKFCAQRRVETEIGYINPKLIIMHGMQVRDYFQRLLIPFVLLPHIQNWGDIKYPLNLNKPRPPHEIWIKSKEFIQNILFLKE